FHQISYASRVFFTLAMHRRLLTNFSLGRFDLVLGPSLHCLPPQKPHFLDHPLFDRVGLLEISLRVRYGKGYRYESLAKTRVRLKNCQKRPVAQFRRRHLPSPHRFSNRQLTPHHFESHPRERRHHRIGLARKRSWPASGNVSGCEAAHCRAPRTLRHRGGPSAASASKVSSARM